MDSSIHVYVQLIANIIKKNKLAVGEIKRAGKNDLEKDVERLKQSKHLQKKYYCEIGQQRQGSREKRRDVT